MPTAFQRASCGRTTIEMRNSPYNRLYLLQALLLATSLRRYVRLTVKEIDAGDFKGYRYEHRVGNIGSMIESTRIVLKNLRDNIEREAEIIVGCPGCGGYIVKGDALCANCKLPSA